MKKFIKKISLFSIAFIIVTYLLQNILFFGIKSIKVGEYGVLNKIYRGEINADILISGSSRSLKGINPEIIEKETGLSCYNISSDGVSLEIQLPKLKMYLNKNKAPRILIQDVSILGGHTMNKIYEPYKYLPYIDDNDLFSGLEEIDPDFWKHKYIHLTNLPYFNFDFYVKLFSELRNSYRDKNNLIKGHIPDNSKWSTSIEQFKINRPKGITAQVSDDYTRYLNELIDVCISNKIILVLTALPYYEEIYSVVNKTVDMEDFFSQMSNNDNVFFFNYSQCELSASTNFFYNFSHLNSFGANKFSEILSGRLMDIINDKILISDVENIN